MTTTTLERQPAANSASSSSAQPAAAAPARPAAKAATLLLGLDLGTNKSCVLAGPAGTNDITVSKVVPSVVGYVKDGIVDGIITNNARILYGEEALTQMLHVDLVAPLAEGVISHPDSARDFMQHIRLLADPSGKADIREELDRLKTHVAAARALIDGGGAIGRRLDFLAQELAREARRVTEYLRARQARARAPR